MGEKVEGESVKQSWYVNVAAHENAVNPLTSPRGKHSTNRDTFEHAPIHGGPPHHDPRHPVIPHPTTPRTPDNGSTHDSNNNQPPHDIQYSESQMEEFYSNKLEDVLKARYPNNTQTQDKFRFYLQYPSTVPQQDQHAFDEIQREALTQLQKAGKVPNGWTRPTADSSKFRKTLTTTVDDAAAALISPGKTPTKDQQQQIDNLIFAFYHPGRKGPKVSDHLLATLKENVATALQTQPKGYVVPANWTPDTKDYDIELFDKASAAFEGAVDNLGYLATGTLPNEILQQLQTAWEAVKPPIAFKVPLSDADVRQLITMFYLPNNMIDLANNPDAAQLKAIFPILSQYIVKTMPAGWDPNSPTNAPLDAQFYTGTISANYRYENDDAINKYLQEQNPPLSSSDEALLRQAVDAITTRMINNGNLSILNSQNLTLPGIPDNITQIALGIASTTIEDLQSKYGISTKWVPNKVALVPPNPVKEGIINTLKDQFAILQSYVESMPPSPQRAILLNFLKLVAEALDTLQQSAYKSEAATEMGAIDLTKAQQELMNGKIKAFMDAFNAQQAQMDAVHKQQEKAAKMGPIMKAVTVIVAVIMVVATVVSFGTLGPVAFGIIMTLALASTADAILTVAGKDPVVMNFIMNIVGEYFLHDVCQVSNPAADIAGKVITIVLLCIAGGVGVAGMANVAKNALLVGSDVAVNSNVVTDICQAAGASDETTMWVSLGVNLALAFVSMGAMASSSLRQVNKAADEAMTSLNNEIKQLSKNIKNIEGEIEKMPEGVLKNLKQFQLMLLKLWKGLKQTNLKELIDMKGATKDLKEAEEGLKKAQAAYKDKPSLWTQRALEESQKAVASTKKSIQELTKKSILYRGVMTARTVTLVATTGIQAANAKFNYDLEMLKAALYEINAQADAKSANYDDLIAAIKATITRMQALLNTFVQWIGDIGKQQAEKYQSLKVPYPA